MVLGFGLGLFFLFPLLLLGRFFWIILLVLLIAGLVRGFGYRRWRAPYYGYPYRFGTPPSWSNQTNQPSPLDILRMRYARGEIDAVTFEQMRERLEGNGEPRQQ